MSFGPLPGLSGHDDDDKSAECVGARGRPGRRIELCGLRLSAFEMILLVWPAVAAESASDAFLLETGDAQSGAVDQGDGDPALVSVVCAGHALAAPAERSLPAFLICHDLPVSQSNTCSIASW